MEMLHLPESRVRIVFNELRGIFNSHFLNQRSAVSQGADFKVDEVVFVRPLWILWGEIPLPCLIKTKEYKLRRSANSRFHSLFTMEVWKKTKLSCRAGSISLRVKRV